MATVTINLPDGSKKVFSKPATVAEVAAAIGKRLAADAVAGKVDGKLVDTFFKIERDASLEIITKQSKESAEILRHSSAHLMAQAVARLFGPVKLWVGPPLLEGRYGFYYDMDLDHRIVPEDFPKIEAEMMKIAAENLSPERFELPVDEAVQLAEKIGQPYKVELIKGFGVSTVSFYKQGEFTDLCEGPHLPRTGFVGGVKIMNVTGAYLHGDQSQKMLQRVYGCAFFSQKELDAHLAKWADAEKRDHRRLGTELDLFFFDPIAPGHPFFLPKGAFLFNGLISYMRRHYEREGYQEVVTPQVFLSQLWKQSGHYDHYKDNMYFCKVGDDEFGVKPMNCPSHALIFKSRHRSYRELPLRLADFGMLHRLELSGVVGGLTRVRRLTQDDAHIFCAPEQIEDEIANLIRLGRKVYKTFGMPLRAELSTRPPQSLGSDELWTRAEGALQAVLQHTGEPFQVKKGEGAFYGPKIDFHAKDALDREWQLFTIQLDFNLAERFDLEYASQKGSRERPVVIHRAILGSIERFLGVLIEHTGGDFPLWLAPIQVRVLAVTDKQNEYAERIEKELRILGIRVDRDTSSEKIGAKIRKATLEKIRYMAIVGEEEAKAKPEVVALRDRKNLDKTDSEWVSPKELAKRILEEIPA